MPRMRNRPAALAQWDSPRVEPGTTAQEETDTIYKSVKTSALKEQAVRGSNSIDYSAILKSFNKKLRGAGDCRALKISPVD